MKATKRNKIAVNILIIFILALSSWAFADDVYVDCRNETGPWDGSLDYPYQRIQDAIDAGTTYDGDTIRVSDCIYEEGIVVDKYLQIYGSGPDVTVIDATDVPGKDSAVVINSNRTAIISGFRIASAKYGVKLETGSNTVIANNIVNAEYGIYTSNVTANIEIKNNTIVGCTERGIQLNGGLITAKIYNNIITSNDQYGIYIQDHTNLSNSYNNVWNNGTANYHNCSAGAGSISENPRFVDSGTGNYRLQVLSPCVDAGWPVKTELDPDGTRNNMGAYGGSGAAIFWPDSPGAPVVTDLTVTPAAVPADGKVTIKAIGRVRPYSSGQE